MKSSLTLLVLVLLLLNFMAGCAPSSNESKGTAGEHDLVAGLWLGLWHGSIGPIVLVVSLFKTNLGIYEVHNNEAWYNFGYLFGLACFFGGGGNQAARRRKPLCPAKSALRSTVARKKCSATKDWPALGSHLQRSG